MTPVDDEGGEVEVPAQPWDWALVPTAALELANSYFDATASFFHTLQYGAMSHFNWRQERRRFVVDTERTLKELNRAPVE